MVGNTGRKCISQGINVIAGGSQCMRYSYKPSLSQKSSKFDQLTHQIVSMLTCEYKIWDWIYLPAEKFPTCASGRKDRGPAALLSFRHQFHLTRRRDVFPEE